jgi:hypothetical protein
MTAPTAGAELRYQERPHRGQRAPPLGRGSSKRVPSAGQNLYGSVALKGTFCAASVKRLGPRRVLRRRRRVLPRCAPPRPGGTWRSLPLFVSLRRPTFPASLGVCLGPTITLRRGVFINTSFSLKVFCNLCYANRAYLKERGKRARPLVKGDQVVIPITAGSVLDKESSRLSV